MKYINRSRKLFLNMYHLIFMKMVEHEGMKMSRFPQFYVQHLILMAYI